MRIRLAVLTGLLGLALPLPAAAQSASAAAMSPVQAEAHKAAGDELAAIVVPDSIVESQTDRLVEALMAQLFSVEGKLQELETAFPGMKDALGAGVKPVIVRHSYRLLPLQRAELSAVYQANLTTDEAKRAVTFMRSPPFVAFIKAAYANVDYSATAKALAEEKNVTGEELGSDIGAAGMKSGAAISAKDQAAIIGFLASPLGKKLLALNPQKLAIDAKWANYSDAEAEKEIYSAVEHAMLSHIALSDPETAELMRKELAKTAE